MGADVAEPGLEYLLASPEPAIRHAALTELVGRSAEDADVRAARRTIADGPIVSRLLAGQRTDGGFGVNVYGKWAGAHWRLVSLMDLAVPPETSGLRAAYETVLRWLGPAHAARAVRLEGRWRRCASQEGNAVAVGTWLGFADDPRLRRIVASLVEWQWPDGGWNCDVRPGASHSSFNESCATLLGLARFAAATGNPEAAAAADRAAEFFLRHRVIFAERSGELAHPVVGTLHYPPYWHHDLLAGLIALGAADRVRDARAADALDLLEAKRRPDGTWQTGGRWWRRPGSKGSNVEVVDWGGRGPSAPLTLNALRVLRAAGRGRTRRPG